MIVYTCMSCMLVGNASSVFFQHNFGVKCITFIALYDVTLLTKTCAD